MALKDVKKAKKGKEANLENLGLEEMGNIPPQALDFERMVLGAIMLDAHSVDTAIEELDDDCFYSPIHAMIFQAITSLVNDHSPVDIITVSHKLQSLGQLEAIGGNSYLVSLSADIGAGTHVEYYAKVLKEKRIQRDLIKASYGILKAAFDDSVSSDDLIDKAESDIYAAIQDGSKKEVEDIASVIRKVITNLEERQDHEGYIGVPSGYPKLDEITNGWQKSDLIILAARPSVGKTAFALNIARNAAVDAAVPVAIFSLEMPANQLALRLMLSETEIPAQKLKGSVKLSSEDWDQLNARIVALEKAPIYIDSTPSIPVMEFRSKVKRLVKTNQVGLVIVDYLQLMQGPNELRGMREQEVAAISRMLKATAKEMDIPIIALSQLSRNAATRMPILSDLRESGSIEQDADMVIFVHRPEYVALPGENSSKEELDINATYLNIAKHRNGGIGEIKMRFNPDTVRFYEEESSFDSLYPSKNLNNKKEEDVQSFDPSNMYPSTSSDFDVSIGTGLPSSDFE